MLFWATQPEINLTRLLSSAGESADSEQCAWSKWVIGLAPQRQAMPMLSSHLKESNIWPI
jgi:hypothetical protein